MPLFRSRYPSLHLIGPGDRAMVFRQGEFRTDDPVLLAALRDVCRAEARSNRAVWEVAGDDPAPDPSPFGHTPPPVAPGPVPPAPSPPPSRRAKDGTGLARAIAGARRSGADRVAGVPAGRR